MARIRQFHNISPIALIISHQQNAVKRFICKIKESIVSSCEVDFLSASSYSHTPKIVAVGTGFVGSSFAYSLMINGIVSEIVLIDVDKKRAEGEAVDLNHGVCFVRPVRVWAGDYQDCQDADIIVITAGLAQKPGESRLDLMTSNVEIFRQIIPTITA